MRRCVPKGAASSSSDIRKFEDMDEISQAVEVDRSGGGEGAGISVVAEIRNLEAYSFHWGVKEKVKIIQNIHVQNTQHCNQNRSWHQKLQKFRANPDDSCGEKVPNYDSD